MSSPHEQRKNSITAGCGAAPSQELAPAICIKCCQGKCRDPFALSCRPELLWCLGRHIWNCLDSSLLASQQGGRADLTAREALDNKNSSWERLLGWLWNISNECTGYNMCFVNFTPGGWHWWAFERQGARGLRIWVVSLVIPTLSCDSYWSLVSAWTWKYSPLLRCETGFHPLQLWNLCVCIPKGWLSLVEAGY